MLSDADLDEALGHALNQPDHGEPGESRRWILSLAEEVRRLRGIAATPPIAVDLAKLRDRVRMNLDGNLWDLASEIEYALEELDRKRGIVRDLAEADVMDDEQEVCVFCEEKYRWNESHTVIALPADEHAKSCPWRRAQEETRP